MFSLRVLVIWQSLIITSGADFFFSFPEWFHTDGCKSIQWMSSKKQNKTKQNQNSSAQLNIVNTALNCRSVSHTDIHFPRILIKKHHG